MAKKKLENEGSYATLQRILKKNPRKIVKDFLEFRNEDVNVIIKNSGLELQEIAKGLNITRGALRKKMNGEIQWSAEDLQDLLNFLGIE
jgi:hypothetical protein